jgi:hypothetical protein
MRIISSIEDREIIKAILKHLGLWLVRARPPPKIHAPPVTAYPTDDLSPYSPPDAQFLRQAQDGVYGDPDYS